MLCYIKNCYHFMLVLQISLLQKLSEESDDSFHNSEWADNLNLKRQFQGLNNIEFRPGKKL